METCLTVLTSDTSATLHGFELIQGQDKGEESGKKKGGGLAEFVNDSVTITTKKQLCSC